METTSFSLLDRLREQPDDESWQRLVALYTPLIHGWLRRQAPPSCDHDDLVQEVMSVVVRRLPDFEHNGRIGAFRAWLRTITVNCVRDYWKARKHRPVATGESDFLAVLNQLEDPASQVSQLWDREHDEHVARRLLELIEPLFAPTTWQAFRGVTLEGRSTEEVAQALGITPNAVFIAKSRVLARLRQEARGLVE